MLNEKPNYVFVNSRAEDLLEQFRIDDAPIPVESIAKQLGFAVLIADFDDAKISGFVRLDPKMEIILSRSDAPTRRAFTLAHEIGHYILHRDQLENDSSMAILYRKPIGGEKDPIEKEANAFAATLLVPEFLLRKYHNYDLSESQMASIFGVSTEVMHYRLIQTGRR